MIAAALGLIWEGQLCQFSCLVNECLASVGLGESHIGQARHVHDGDELRFLYTQTLWISDVALIY